MVRLSAIGERKKEIIPVIQNIRRKLYPCEAYVTVKKKTSKAMADQIMTVSKQRLIDKIGTLSVEEMLDVEHILKVQLGLT